MDLRTSSSVPEDYCSKSSCTKIVEGAITLFLAIFAWFLIPPFPEGHARFLKPEQTKFIIERINEDRGDALIDEVTAQKIKRHLCDWTLWAYATMNLCNMAALCEPRAGSEAEHMTFY